MGLIGTESSAPHSRREAAEIPSQGPFLGPISAFWAKPPFTKARLDFSDPCGHEVQSRHAQPEMKITRGTGEDLEMPNDDVVQLSLKQSEETGNFQ